jgi:predicted methyltransferase
MFGRDLGRLVTIDTAEINLIAHITQHPDRPTPLRAYDQIYMLPGSQLIQAKLIADYLYKRDVVLMGDGDCMALVLALLAQAKIIDKPAHMTVLDFDQRILTFIQNVSKELKLEKDLIETVLYNVRDPTPVGLRERADVFYTNPPYGSADQGHCGRVFIGRCMELCKSVGSWGVAILPFEHHTPWSRIAMANIQPFLIANGYIITEMIRGVHEYLALIRSRRHCLKGGYDGIDGHTQETPTRPAELHG